MATWSGYKPLKIDDNFNIDYVTTVGDQIFFCFHEMEVTSDALCDFKTCKYCGKVEFRGYYKILNENRD